MNRVIVIVGGVALAAIAILSVLLANSRADLTVSESQRRSLLAEVEMQGGAIARQAFNIQRFNTISDAAARVNQIASAGAEQSVIEYREILKHEKTCDFRVPASIAGELFEYAHRLRAGAMRADPTQPDAAGYAAAAPSALTYCQAVLWVKPLLVTIETANNQLAGIREAEAAR